MIGTLHGEHGRMEPSQKEVSHVVVKFLSLFYFSLADLVSDDGLFETMNKADSDCSN